MIELIRTAFASNSPRRAALRRVERTVLVLGLLAASGLTQHTFATEPVFTSKARFRIPYQLDEEEINRLGATEIQLHVSTDNGANWRHVDSVPPVAGKFTFDAAGDGAYAFAVRTLDRDGRPHPDGPLAASLHVIVDATPPSLVLDVHQADAGRVKVGWRASDVHLDRNSLVLEYLDAATNGWQPIHVTSAATGQTSWSVPEGGTVRVRGTIRDQAGNDSLAEATAANITPQKALAQPVIPEPRQPIAVESRAVDLSATSPTPLPAINPGSVVISRPVAAIPESPPAAEQPRWEHTPAPVHQAAPAVRRVNSTTFQIAYEIDDVGPSGVSSVDLYLTENQGGKWYHYGVDEDHRSPFQVSVPSDGTYGFAIRVRSGVGLAMNPPQPHDPPEVSVAVDRQPPRVTLSPLRQGHGSTSHQLLIEWTVTDDALAEEPVALYYSEHRTGPWQALTGWVRNTNRYAWTLGPHIPPQVYVRLEARDAAGNHAQVETETPMIIDLSRPTARILNVESVR